MSCVHSVWRNTRLPIDYVEILKHYFPNTEELWFSNHTKIIGLGSFGTIEAVGSFAPPTNADTTVLYRFRSQAWPCTSSGGSWSFVGLFTVANRSELIERQTPTLQIRNAAPDIVPQSTCRGCSENFHFYFEHNKAKAPTVSCKSEKKLTML